MISNESGSMRKKLAWPNLRHYSDICLDGLRKTTNLSQDSQCPSPDTKQSSLEYVRLPLIDKDWGMGISRGRGAEPCICNPPLEFWKKRRFERKKEIIKYGNYTYFGDQ
jgi:hypothetical protein